MSTYYRINKSDGAYSIITDDWEDEILHDVDDHGTKSVTRLYCVDDELIKNYPTLEPFKGYWGRNVEHHPSNGEIFGDDFIVRYEQKEVVSLEWIEVV